MHVVIVRSRQDLIAFAQWQPVVEKSKTGCGVLGQRDLPRIATNVAGDGPANLQRNVLLSRFENRAIHGNERICVYFFPVLINRLSYRPGMRSEKEQGEMNVIGSEVELRAHGFPIFEIGK